ncbi:MAG: YfhO family protein [Pirellulales bacterium]
MDTHDTPGRLRTFAERRLVRHIRDVYALASVAAILGGIAICVVLAWPCLQGRVYLGDDLGAYHLPARAFFARQLAGGESFDWCPGVFGGYFLSAEGQAGMYHPCHQAIYRWLPLHVAFAIELIAPLPLAFLGTCFFLRRRWGDSAGRLAAAAGGLFFAFSAFNLLHFVHTNAIAVIAHLPWLLWAEDRLLTGKTSGERAIPALMISLLIGSQLLLGYPQFVWFSLLAMMALAAATIRTGERVASWVQLGGALFQGLLIGGVQWVPTLDLLRHSARESVTAAEVLEGSLHPWSFVEVVGPYLFVDRVVGQNTHELACYFGVVPLVLVVWFWARRREFDSSTRLFYLGWLLFAAAALGLALGKYGPFGELLTYLPVVGKFRFPSRYVGLATWGVSLTAAAAVMKLSACCNEHTGKVATLRLPRSLLITVVVSVTIAALAPWLWGAEHLGAAWKVAAGPALIVAAVILVLAAERGYRIALPCLLLLAAADLGLYGLSYAPLRKPGSLADFAAGAVVPPIAGSSTYLHDRVVCDLPSAAKLSGNRITLAGYQRWDGYAGLAPQRFLDQGRLSTLRLAGVRWVARTPQAERINGLIPRSNLWLEVPKPLPKYRLVTQVVVDANPAATLDRINIETCAVVDDKELFGAELPWTDDVGQTGSVKVRQESAGYAELVTQTKSRQFLVISESFHPGWQARVDGQQVVIHRTNGDFCGCVVPAGDHVVQLEFRPASLRWGLVLTLLGLLLASGQFVVGWRATSRAVPLAQRQTQSTTRERELLPSTD